MKNCICVCIFFINQQTLVLMWSLVFLWAKWRVYGGPWLALPLTFRVTYISKVEPSLQDQASFPVSLSLSTSLYPCKRSILFSLSPSIVLYRSLFLPHSLFPQALEFIFAITTWTTWTTCPLPGSCSSPEFSRPWTSATSQRSSMYSQVATWKSASPHVTVIITHAEVYTCRLFSCIALFIISVLGCDLTALPKSWRGLNVLFI